MQSGNIGLICTCDFMIIVLLLNQSVHLSPMRNLLSRIKSPIVIGLRRITKMRILMLGYMVDSLTVSYMYYPSAKSIDDSLEMIGKKSSAQENFITSKLSK